MYTDEIALTQLRLRRVEELFYGREPKAPQLLLQLLCQNQPLHKLHDLLSDADIGNLNAVDRRMKERFQGDSPIAFGRRIYFSYPTSGYLFHSPPKIKGSVSVLPLYQLTGQADFVTDQPFPTSHYLYERAPSDFALTLNLPKAPQPRLPSNEKSQRALQRRLEQELSLLEHAGSSHNLRTWLALLNVQLSNLQALFIIPNLPTTR